MDSEPVTKAEEFSQPLLSEVMGNAAESGPMAMVYSIAFPQKAKKVENTFSSEVFSQSTPTGDTRERWSHVQDSVGLGRDAEI